MAGLDFETWQFAVAVLVLVVAGAVQGSTGFGFNSLAAPVLAIITPAFIPGPMLLISLMVSVSGMIREWGQVDFSGLSTALIGRLAASIIAVLCLGLLDATMFSRLFGAMVLLAVAMSLSGIRIQPTPRTLFFAGSLSGFMGTLTSIGAPPMAMAYQNVHGSVMRSTLNSFFVAGAFFSIVALVVSGHFTFDDLILGIVMCPFAFAGFLFSHWGRLLVDGGWARSFILGTSAASGAFLIARTVW
ncbi:sulfite exporter TauE/SafE family protein [Aureimonas fodinaquatilis]|uniref:Probable membrane transporter protein n=2 Tax=Aureimonas fodinaquatilis TaxID=2565783 RepID=A0A5B0DYS5_9HYPH|nr:sulfite exporter TauE/SafE family protein [Aureimonas fodinaquatilis]